MFKKSLLLAVFSGLALFSVSVLSENMQEISIERNSAYSNQVALLDTVKMETERFMQAPAETGNHHELKVIDNEFVSMATGLALLTFGLIGFVMRSSRPHI